MNGPELLQKNLGCLKTGMGACFPGSRAVFRGHDLHMDLKDMDWLELYFFGITGRRLSSRQLHLLHAMWVYTSYPDARIWNNRVAALAGSSRSTPVLGISAALAVSEAVIYGGYPCVRAIDFLRQMQRQTEQGMQLDKAVREELKVRRIYGYGRPINSSDERLPWFLARAHELELDKGPHLRVAFEIEGILLSINKALRMNYAGLTAALAADMGFSVEEFHLFMLPVTLAGMPPCYIESAHRPEGTLFPLRCSDILYEGLPKRRWDSGNNPSIPG